MALPVKDVKPNGKWEMTNLIGQYEDIMYRNIYKDQDYLPITYLWERTNVKPGRKMGHLNKRIS